MGIRLSGLSSGMDTDTIIKQLMSAQSYKKTKVESKKTKLEWKKDIWSDLNSKINSFYNNTLSKMRLQATFKTKAATSSDTSKLTATANSNAAEGTYKVKVTSLASAQYVTSGKLSGAIERDKDGNIVRTDGNVVDKDGNIKNKDGNIVGTDNGDITNYKRANVSSSTKLVDLLDATGNSTFGKGTQIKVTTEGGAYSTLYVDENTTVSDFLSTCTDAGLTASFDADQQRFFISSSKSGVNQGFKISASTPSPEQQKAIDSLKEAVGYKYLSSSDQKSVNKILDKLQADKITEDDANELLDKYLDKSQKSAVETYYKKIYTDDYNTRYFKHDASGELALDANGKKQLDGDTAKTDWITSQVAAGKTQEAAEKSWDKLTDAQKISKVEAMVKSKVSEDIKEDSHTDASGSTTTGAVANGIANGGFITNTTDPGYDSFLNYSSAKRSQDLIGSVGKYMDEMIDNAGDATSANAQLKGLGLGEVTGNPQKEEDNGNITGMVVVAASDAKITLNGATLTSSDSTITVNGLTLNVLEETNGKEISISVTKDTSAIYDTVKDFISEYNDILKTMNTHYNAASSRGYDVLTDEQKEAMSDKEIELWESKIKDSLLRRDTTLGAIISSFRTDMMGSYTASDGKRYSLASLGITTSAKNWQEGGLLHIQGDEDDTEYMDKENKLEAMIAKDPDLVMEILNGLAGNLYGDLQKKMGTSRVSSAFTFYNDKEMNSQLSDYTKQITDWEAKLADLENRYYKQFSAMEAAMAKVNSQQNYFSSMMG